MGKYIQIAHTRMNLKVVHGGSASPSPPLIPSLLLCLVTGSPGEPSRRFTHLKCEAAPEWPKATRSGCLNQMCLVGEMPLQYVGSSFLLKAFHFQRALGL